jgi:hypothetical protein
MLSLAPPAAATARKWHRRPPHGWMSTNVNRRFIMADDVPASARVVIFASGNSEDIESRIYQMVRK